MIPMLSLAKQKLSLSSSTLGQREVIPQASQHLHTAKNHPSPNHCPSLLASDGYCRTNKASFHAAGAPAALALRPLAAVARESSSRVDQVSCRERVFQSREQSDPHGS